MLMVISPAKTLDYETPPVTQRFTQPQYLDHSQELIQQLRELSPAQISELMHVSDKIGGLNEYGIAAYKTVDDFGYAIEIIGGLQIIDTSPKVATGLIAPVAQRLLKHRTGVVLALVPAGVALYAAAAQHKVIRGQNAKEGDKD